MPASASAGNDNNTENTFLGLNPDNARASQELLNYQSGDPAEPSEKDLIAKAVFDAGLRLGETAGYRDQSSALFKVVEPYDQYLSKIFDFQEMMLPNGIVPPVLAENKDTISYKQTKAGLPSKEIRARVLSTVKNARFANPRAPSWRDYLRLTTPPLEKPHPQLQEEIDKHRDEWQTGVQKGYERGIENASQAFQIAINELSRDYTGMQLFRILWVTGQAQPPKIVEQNEHVVGGGSGSREMSIGVKRAVITEPVYFVNDTSQWEAILTAAFDKRDSKAAGLNDIIKNTDNTQHIPSAVLEPDLNAR